jgi:hypothetical protein
MATNDQVISKLHPIVYRQAKLLLDQCSVEGIKIIITQGLRTMAEQAALYNQGRTTPGNIVTNAKAGYSNHNYGLAFDFALIDANGKAYWNEKDPKWVRVVQIAKGLGFDWGGDWASFKDYPHFEMTFGLSINDLLSGKKPPEEVSTTMEYNKVYHERFYAKNDVMYQVSRKVDGKINYGVQGTDIRWIKFQCGQNTYKFPYEEGAKVSDLVKKYGADYGFNFPFFWEGKVLGDAEDDDAVISAAYGKMLKWHEFAAIDGKPIIGQLDKADDQDFLVQSGPLLMYNGEPVWDWMREVEEIPDDIGKSRAQRTFAGTTIEGDLIVAVADGRTIYDIGLTLEEEYLFMKSVGAFMALNGDGGSSSVLADKSGSLGQNKGSAERAVHHAVLVFNKPPIQEFDKEAFIAKYLSPAWFEAPNQTIKDTIHECAEKIRIN